MADSALTLRPATDADLGAIIAVGAAALGWDPAEPNEELFRWKHVDNSFGRSPIWVAESAGRIAGYRAFMRWELRDRDGRTWRAVRAVDTATHPEFQRQGIFSRLTQHAVDEVRAEGVDIVFNTPNTQSRPGYLKMGWVDVGRLPVAVRPTSVSALPRILRARTAADKWSEHSSAGQPAAPVCDDPAIEALIAGQPARAGLSTVLSSDFVRWRYCFEPLRYRAWVPDDAADGVVFFRVRRRGAARECAVSHVLAPEANVARSRDLLTGLAAAVDADYLVRIGAADLRSGFLPAPRQGPRLTARAVASRPPEDLSDWNFQLGDIELF